MLELKDLNPRDSRKSTWLQKQYSWTFISWFKKEVQKLLANGEDICVNVRWLAKGPNFAVSKYNGFAINEYHFHTTSRDESRTTQCNGVYLVAYTMQIASAKESNSVYGAVTYFDRINDTWELDYRMFTIHEFMCDLVDSRGVKKDNLGFIVVNFDRLDQQDENLHAVGFTPHKMYKYGSNDETDDMLELEATFDLTQVSTLLDLEDNFLCTRSDDSASDHDEDSKQRGVLVGKEATKLSTFQGLVAGTMVPITYESWLEDKSMKAKKVRAHHKYNHHLSRKGYDGLINEIMQETGKTEEEIDRTMLWKKARELKTGGHKLDVKITVDRINVKPYLEIENERLDKRINKLEDGLEKLKRGVINVSEAASCQVGGVIKDVEKEPPEESLDNSCLLAVDFTTNVVAKGTIVKYSASDENIQVMMETILQGDALLPMTLEEEFIVMVKDAPGYILSWPRHLVIRCSDLGKVVAKHLEKHATPVKKDATPVKEDATPLKEEI
uniref:Transposase Tnp1/En/Spm-like domain-containing protein n=1 Tax=Lactuca sativa TaxID=4236 RepID=A0A9R1UUD0_LACSA|nr:hypothetical protein LSAT_V11C800436100 [Lactuca sativa]